MTIEQLEKRIDQLEQMVLQIARGNVNTIGKVDDTSNKVTAITPYTETKTAYIDDEDCVFNNVPNGLVAVYLNGVSYYNFTVTDGRVLVWFSEPLEKVTEVTISIQ